jgi:hypothetical protein
LGSQYAAHASISFRRFSKHRPPICLFGLVADDMRQRRLGDFAWEVGDVACPVPEAIWILKVSSSVNQKIFQSINDISPSELHRSNRKHGFDLLLDSVP